MTSKPNKICYLKPTADLGYDPEAKRYFAMLDLYITKKQEAYLVYVSCDDYDVTNDTMKHFTIEFLTYTDSNNIQYPYDKELFQELEVAAMEIFCDLKAEEQTG